MTLWTAGCVGFVPVSAYDFVEVAKFLQSGGYLVNELFSARTFLSLRAMTLLQSFAKIMSTSLSTYMDLKSKVINLRYKHKLRAIYRQ